MLAVRNKPNKKLVAEEDLAELFSNGRFEITVSKSSLCSLSETTKEDDDVNDDGFMFVHEISRMPKLSARGIYLSHDFRALMESFKLLSTDWDKNLSVFEMSLS